ncbi:adenylate cyclase [Halobellus salinus]|uniref:Adenylate cyclase n=1 Tax=Halobellus salinus TaxID=931585 RepID=A0A830EBU8_9EURY|nr:class IV adenylate cyclase [Halobellus salinus]GGJ09174.1 adenylate cyclase [Halobellus salinus]SMP27219.1 adenylate cyclase [Halobellus salinus]
MYEVELKLRADHDSVREALNDAGASLDRRVRQVDTYYDAPHRDFAETDEALRLRAETRERVGASGAQAPGDHSDVADAEPTTRVTYKGPLVEAESKTREEHETEVVDGDEAADILAGLGFEPAAVVEKDRTFFELDGYTVSLDRVDGLGEFVEVEAETAASDAVAEVREGAADVLSDLGLDPDDQIRTSYLGLLLDAEN